MTIDRVLARPVREWLTCWAWTTGDPIHVIAIGFDLDAELVAELLGPEPPRMLDVDVARDVCRKLRADPRELWPPTIAQGLGRVNWATERLWPTAALWPRRGRIAGSGLSQVRLLDGGAG